MEFENVEDVYSLSPIQEGMLFHTIAEPNSGVFVEQIGFTIDGELDVARFQESWSQTVQRHTVLRTIFLWDGLDEPLQVVREKVKIPWQQWDWSNKNAATKDADFNEFLRKDRQQGLDLTQAPLMRMLLVRTNKQQHRFIWTFHHLLTDGWSTPLVLQEVLTNYVGLVKQRPVTRTPPFAYKDFIAHLQTQSLPAAESYWRNQLSGFTTPTRIVDHAHEGDKAKPTDSQRQKLRINVELSENIKAFARTNRVTLNTMLLGAWGLLLSTYSREQDVVFGATVSGRPPDLDGVESAVGLFINTLPVRVRTDHGSLVDWLQSIQRQQIEIRQFEYSPLAAVQRWGEIPRGESLFESIVVFENYPEAIGEDLNSVGISVGDFEYLEQSNYPLALLVVPQDRIELYLVHDASRFSPPFAGNLLQQLEQTLQLFTVSGQTSLTNHRLISIAEQQRLHTQFRGESIAIEQRSLHELIERHVPATPNAEAVVFEGATLTYQQLDEQANQLAQQLRDRGLRANAAVGLYVERSLDMLVGILGILKAHAAYVPLDPTYPEVRLAQIAHDANLALVVTQPQLIDMAGRLGAATCTIDRQAAAQTHSAHPGYNNSPGYTKSNDGDHAYVIYTSGSEGRPKGVPVSHRNIVSSTLARRHFYPGKPGKFLLLSSHSFDSSMVGIFWTLAEGGTLVLPSSKIEQDLDKLASLIQEQQITHMLCLPSLYTLLLQHADHRQLDSLQTVIVAGQSCSSETIRQHHQSLPHARFYNEYGPTEATVWCVASELTSKHQHGPVPIGRPIANTQVYVLDAYDRPVPQGACGELCVAGENLTRGYLGRDDLTRERFVSDPFADAPTAKMYRTGDLVYGLPNGDLVYVGRVDQQVKIRGYRIELAEIENAILAIETVNQAAVIAPKVVSQTTPQAIPTTDELTHALRKLGPSEAKRLIADVAALSASEIERQLAEQNL